MARPRTPDTAEATLTFLYNGQYCINKHHFLNTAGWDEGSLNNLGTAIREWWADELQASAPSTLSLIEIEVIDLSPDSNLGITVQTGLPLVGGNAAQQMPNNVTIAVKKGTGLVGRSYRGRTYHIGLTEANVDMNVINSSTQTLLQTAYDALKEPLGIAIPVDMCVLSETTGGVQRAEGICTPVTGINVDPVIDSQRRRLPGRGN
jgi:hypothetical protein